MSSALFSPFELCKQSFDNRIVVAPMCQYAAEDGVVGDWHLMHLGNLAVSGVGLLIFEATGVEARGRITPKCPGLWNDRQAEAFERVIHFCRQYSDTKLGIQLAHAGRKASARPPFQGGTPIIPEDPTGWQTIGPSANPFTPDWPVPEMMNETDMDVVKTAFVSATHRSIQLGFDFLEIHAAHGYLLSAFLSPLSNLRNDKYGGSLDNRMRYPLEVVGAVRNVWPEDKPLCVRFNGTDWIEDGWSVDDSVDFSKELYDVGVNIVHLSSGGNTADRPPVGPGTPGYQLPAAEAIRKGTGMPTMGVGYINEPEFAEEVIATGQADMVAIGRGMLYNPRFAWHAAETLGGEAAYQQRYERSQPKLWPNAFETRRNAP